MILIYIFMVFASATILVLIAIVVNMNMEIMSLKNFIGKEFVLLFDRLNKLENEGEENESAKEH